MYSADSLAKVADTQLCTSIEYTLLSADEVQTCNALTPLLAEDQERFHQLTWHMCGDLVTWDVKFLRSSNAYIWKSTRKGKLMTGWSEATSQNATVQGIVGQVIEFMAELTEQLQDGSWTPPSSRYMGGLVLVPPRGQQH